jgi:hypothetical protein
LEKGFASFSVGSLGPLLWGAWSLPTAVSDGVTFVVMQGGSCKRSRPSSTSNSPSCKHSVTCSMELYISLAAES